MAVAQYLKNGKTKEQAIAELREGAAKTETKFDDAAVDVFADMWDYVVPLLVQKL